MSLGWTSVSFGVFGNLKSEGTLLGASGFLAEVVFSVVIVSGGCHPNLLPEFLQKGQLGSHPHFSAIGMMIDCSPVLGSSFMRGFGLATAVVSLLPLFKWLGGSNQSFLSSKRFHDIFPALGHGVLSQTGASSKGGGLFSEASAWGLTLIGALEFVACGHVADSLGPGG